MIAIDTNVLLRHILQDDYQQSPKASTLIEKHDCILITDVVLIETIWTLLGKKYQASFDDIIKLISDLLSDPVMSFENPQVIWQALNDFRADYPATNTTGAKRKRPDFADALILNKAKHLAKEWEKTPCPLYSFDQGVLQMAETTTP